VRRTNKESNNLFAELILRAVGKRARIFCCSDPDREEPPRAETTKPAPQLSERGLKARELRPGPSPFVTVRAYRAWIW
jgi:hypothetical protein